MRHTSRFKAAFFVLIIIAQLLLGVYAPYAVARAEAAAKTPKPLASEEYEPIDAENSPGKSKNSELQLDESDTPGHPDFYKINVDAGEIKSKRGRNQEVFRNEDGTETLKEYLSPKYYQNNGTWDAIDTTLSEDKNAADSGFFGNIWGNIQSVFRGQKTFRTKLNDWHVRFASSDDESGMIRIQYKGDTVTYRPVDAKSVAPVITYDTEGKQHVNYYDLWQGVNVEYVVGTDRLKMNIVLKDKHATNNVGFTIDGAEIVPIEGMPGGYTLTGALEDQFGISPVNLILNQRGLETKDVYRQEYVNGQLRVWVEKEYLQNLPDDAFPAVIDPNTFNSYSGTRAGGNYVSFKSDGYICPSTVCNIYAGSLVDSNNYWRAWRGAFQSPYTRIRDEGGTLVSAKLRLSQLTNAGFWTGNYDTHQFRAAWANCLNSIHCASEPATGYVSFATSGEVDVTAIYKNRIAAGDWGAWLMVLGEECGCSSFKSFNPEATYVEFRYSTSSPESTPSSPANEEVVITDQPTLKVNQLPATTSSGDQIRYYFRANALGSGTQINSGWIVDSQWTVPEAVLQDGTTYEWKVYTSVWADGQRIKTTDPTWKRSFRVDMRNGKDTSQTYDAAGPVSVNMATGGATTSAATHNIQALGGSIGVGLEYNSPLRAKPGLMAKYYNNTSFSGTPAASRLDQSVNFSWGSASPSANVINTDNFSVRWEGYFVAPAAGTYYFGGSRDDNFDIWINGTRIFSATCCGTSYGTGVSLALGQVVPIKVEYKEFTGGALAQLKVKGAVAETTVKSDWLRTAPRPLAPANGLDAYYFNDLNNHVFPTNKAEAIAARTETTMTLNWGAGGPSPLASTDNWMASFEGYITVPTTGNYQFGMISTDDAARVYINGTKIIDDWGAANAVNSTWSGNVSLKAGQSVPIKIEYYEETGGASFNFKVRGAVAEQSVSSTWFSNRAQVLPDGWELSVDPDGSLSYDFAEIKTQSVVLTDAGGDTHEYVWTGSSYKAPENEYGKLTKESDGGIRLVDSDGMVYRFYSNGRLREVSSVKDVRQPAALKYTYSNSPARLTKITDGVDPARFGELYYSGDTRCPAVPSGFSAPPANMLCAFKTSDGAQTDFFYSNGNLARIVTPGDQITDIQYDSSRRITKHKSSLSNDVVTAGQRTDDDSITTQLYYDVLGRTSSVKFPAPTAGATRQEHAYRYYPGANNAGVTETTEIGETEPNGYSMRVEYDNKWRTVKVQDKAALTTKTEWHATKDLIRSATSPTGLKSTTVYDANDLPIESYGPAPQEWYGTDYKPKSEYVDQVPRVATGFDEDINGFSVGWYNVKTNGATGELNGMPRLFTTGFDEDDKEFNYKDFAAGRVIDTASGMQGYGFSATGLITFPSTGTYTFTTYYDDGARLYVDDKKLFDDWNKRTDGGTTTKQTTTFAATAGKPYEIKFDYMHVNDTVGDGKISFWVKGLGITNTHATYGSQRLGTMIKPDYNLQTSQTVYDSILGNSKTTTDYGVSPVYGLAQNSVVDAGGLNLTATSTYETPGASGSYMRTASSSLPGGNTTTFEYYGAQEAVDNPCTADADPVSQAGFSRKVVEQDPDGADAAVSRVREVVYDIAGRTVASRLNTDPWTCTEYDSRGRVTKTTQPDIDGKPGRTVMNIYAVDGNPLRSRTVDSVAGTTESEIDLLGRLKRSVDIWGIEYTVSYDQFSRITEKTGPAGTENYDYDDLDRATNYKIDGVIQTTTTYDAFGRVEQIEYPQIKAADGTILKLSEVKRDALQRGSGVKFTLPDNTAYDEAVQLSQSGRVYGASQTYAEQTLTSTYGFDGAGRMLTATVGSTRYDYSYGAPDTSCSALPGNNINAHKDSNRTSTKITNTLTEEVVSDTYSCYDLADRLTHSSDAQIGTPTYDAHGNTISLAGDGTPITFSYDAGDRNIAIAQGDNRVEYVKAADGSVIRKKEWRDGMLDKSYRYVAGGSILQTCSTTDDNSCVSLDTYRSLPGGITQTITNGSDAEGNATVTTTNSLKNFHGDTVLTLDASGSASSPLMGYGPFGESLLPASTGAATGLSNASNESMGWAAYPSRKQESLFGIPIIQMGARVYLPTLGRFLQVDPVLGGTPNPYVYVSDPVNLEDYNGMLWGISHVTKFASDHWRGIAQAGVAVGTVVAIGAACAATAGIGCVAAGAAIGAASGATSNLAGQVGTGNKFNYKSLALDTALGGVFGAAGGVTQTATIGTLALKSKHFGNASKLIGNKSISVGTRAGIEGTLNQTNNKLRLGWSVMSVRTSPTWTATLRLAIGKTHHVNLIRAKTLYKGILY